MKERWAAFLSLSVVALAFGWIEASVVVYLREIAAREGAIQPAAYARNLQVVLAALPSRFVALETAREASTLVLLAALGWLAGRRSADRIGAFIAAFGLWDLAYYAVLRLVSGWPDSVRTWDVLFLIPVPWVAPVWAPGTVAALLVLGGSYLFLTPDRERRYRWTDTGILLVAGCLVLAAFLAGSRAAIEHRLPTRFPLWLFWSGVALGSAWFVRIERRALQASGDSSSRISSVPPAAGTEGQVEAGIADRTDTRMMGEDTMKDRHKSYDVDRVSVAYRAARSRQDALTEEAGELAERFERIAHALSTRPGHLIVGVPDERLEDPSEWEIVPSHPLPTIEQLSALTEEIRQVGARVEELGEQLILMGHAERLEQPDGFFH